MKHLRHIHPSPDLHWVGNGFPAHSIFDYNGLGRELSPFLLLDYVAPHAFPPGDERRGVGAHPHKGFETVTVAYQGELEHRDSSGGGGLIGPGDVQWMTAGRGIVHQEFHSEDFTRRGGVLQMAQLWVNLRAADKVAPPRYQTLLAKDIPRASLPHGAGEARIIAGQLGEVRGPALTFTPIQLWDLSLRAAGQVELPLTDGHSTALLVTEGSVLAPDGRKAVAGDLAVYSREGATLPLSVETDSRLLLMSGEPIDEPLVGYGPFVMNSLDEIQQAYEEYQQGRMGDLLP